MADTKVSAETLVTAIAANYKMYVVCDTGVAPDSNAARFSQVQDFIRTAFGTANDTGAGFIEAAIQSEMESASSTTLAVTPGRTQYHPGVVKAYYVTDGAASPALNVNHNITSITDNGTGDFTITFATDFSSVNYGWADGIYPGFDFSTNAAPRSVIVESRAAGAAEVETGAFAAASVFLDFIHSVIWVGDQ